MKRVILIALNLVNNSMCSMIDNHVNPMLQKKPTYFNFLPKELREYCIQFVEFPDRETDEELFKRITNHPKVPDEYRKTIQNLIQEPLTPNCFLTYSPNCSKILLVEKKPDNYPKPFNPIATIYDIQSNTITWRDTLNIYSCIGSIALSECGTQFAIIVRKEFICNERIESILTIYDTQSKKPTKNTIPYDIWELNSIHFNKQRTSIVLSFSEIRQKIRPSALPHVTYAISSEKDHLEKSKKTFDDYFQ